MLITMLETRLVSENGFDLVRLHKGETYDIAHTSACMVINRGWGVAA